MNTSSRVLANGDDTIAALATMPGRSATAVIRMSGSRALEIAERITRIPLPAARISALRSLFGAAGETEPFDRCVLTVFPGPSSFTGEDTVEFSVHGGLLVPALVMEKLILAGAREALPGEFTRRALLNGRLDLLQAEAVADLVDSRSRAGAAAAFRQLDGGLTRRIQELRSAILDVEALIAYDIDFPEEDDGPIEGERISRSCRQVIAQLSQLLATAGMGEVLREGALVVIAGLPNAGKSSLFNALVGSRRSLVTEIAGTTRDAIEAVVDTDKWTLRLVDTAGLRETSEIVERLGIEIAEEYLTSAQMVLVCGDSEASLHDAFARARALTRAPIAAVLTKSDLPRDVDISLAQLQLQQHEAGEDAACFVCKVSALSGSGLSELLESIGDTLAKIHAVPDSGVPLLLRARHQRAVIEAKQEMELFVDAFEKELLPVPVAGTHLRAAVGALESLIGIVGVDDVLDRVFSSFCVGK